MVYDNTKGSSQYAGIAGYVIHHAGGFKAPGEHEYELYTDDGKGNGNFICSSNDLYWIRRLAYSLDITDQHLPELGTTFDANGELI